MFFNPHRAAYTANPYAALARLRAETPVFLSLDVQAWIVTRYDICADVLRDHEGFSASREHATGELAARMAKDAQKLPIKVPPLAGTDAPEHTRLRRLVNRVFHPGTVNRVRPAVEQMAAELLDRVEPGEPFDVMSTFAEPLTAGAVAPVIGFPQDAREVGLTALNIIETVRTSPGATGAALAASERAIEQTEEMLSAVEAGDEEALLPALLAAEGRAEIDREQVLSLAAHVGTVGLAPTAGLIGNGLHALLSNPDQLGDLRNNPELIPGAIHELMRYDSPIHAVPRLATRDIELHGRRIRKGEAVFVVAGAANRDPGVFPDPDRLDVRRDARQHLGFGMGPHICLGGPLARMIGEVAIHAVIERFPHLRLHPGGDERAPGFERRMFSKLVVRPEG